jgi:hypothetical protein
MKKAFTTTSIQEVCNEKSIKSQQTETAFGITEKAQQNKICDLIGMFFHAKCGPLQKINEL